MTNEHEIAITEDLDRISIEIWLYLFSFLDLKSLVQLMQVNKTFAFLASDNLLWKQYLERDFPEVAPFYKEVFTDYKTYCLAHNLLNKAPSARADNIKKLLHPLVSKTILFINRHDEQGLESILKQIPPHKYPFLNFRYPFVMEPQEPVEDDPNFWKLRVAPTLFTVAVNRGNKQIIQSLLNWFENYEIDVDLLTDGIKQAVLINRFDLIEMIHAKNNEAINNITKNFSPFSFACLKNLNEIALKMADLMGAASFVKLGLFGHYMEAIDALIKENPAKKIEYKKNTLSFIKNKMTDVKSFVNFEALTTLINLHFTEVIQWLFLKKLNANRHVAFIDLIIKNKDASLMLLYLSYGLDPKQLDFKDLNAPQIIHQFQHLNEVWDKSGVRIGADDTRSHAMLRLEKIIAAFDEWLKANKKTADQSTDSSKSQFFKTENQLLTDLIQKQIAAWKTLKLDFTCGLMTEEFMSDITQLIPQVDACPPLYLVLHFIKGKLELEKAGILEGNAAVKYVPEPDSQVAFNP